MTSWQMRALVPLLRVLYKPRLATEEAGLRRLGQPKRSPEPPEKVTAGRRVERRVVAGFPVVVLHPRSTPEPGVVVYLHGGAYVGEIVGFHWRFLADVADRTGRVVHVPIYGLAPQHDAAEALAFVGAVVAELAEAGGRIHLAGDSAGGGLALLAAQHVNEAHRPAVVGASVMAPWLDLEMANPEVPAVERVDPWLSRAGLVPIAEAWAAGASLRDPSVSPIHGDLAALPPLGVWVGTRDITLPDCRVLRDRVTALGGSVALHEVQGAVHVYPLLPVPEGRRGRAQIVEAVRRSFARP